jgi:hypothetical protein
LPEGGDEFAGELLEAVDPVFSWVAEAVGGASLGVEIAISF